MKNILIAVLIFVTNFCIAQVYVNQIDVNKFDYQYLEMWEHFDKQTGMFYAMVDYGQNSLRSLNAENLKVNEQNGKPMEFKSVISILNFLYRNGWELVTIKTTGEYDSYIMKRIPKMAKATINESKTVEAKDSTIAKPKSVDN
jgi:hypothetical protein